MDSKTIINELLSKSSLQGLEKLLKEEIESLARETGFINRSSSRVSGSMFVDVHTCYFGNKSERSLTDMCAYLQEHYGLLISKQGLDSRYHRYSSLFMQSVYERLLSRFVCWDSVSCIKSVFTGIYLCDSTSFQLPSHLRAYYQSNGGSTSGSSVKIHQRYELLSGKINQVLIGDGKDSDAQYLSEIKLEAGALHIADLGYYQLDHLAKISKNGGYFLSRYKLGTHIYEKSQGGKYNQLCVLELTKNLTQVREVEVYLGEKQKLPVRLVILPVEEQVAQERLKKYQRKQDNQSKTAARDWKTSEEKKQLARFNLFITNATDKQLATEQVWKFYTLRWQIELLFKIWKSVFEIDQVAKMNVFRFECLLYGKLIALLLCSEIQAFLRHHFANDPDIKMELSEWKAMKAIKKNPSVMESDCKG